MSNQIKKIIITGGIGDFLQCLDAARHIASAAGTKIIVVTHFKGAPAFFSTVTKIDNFEFHHFSDLESYFKILKEVKCEDTIDCPRFKYLEIDYPFEVESPFQNSNKIIGIHPFGSAFSKDANTKFKMPIKNITESCVRKLIKNEYNYFIFGAPNELECFKDYDESPNVCRVNHENIWVNLSHVKLCDKMIAVDSAFKSMSLAKKIPTYLILADNNDTIRDKLFIDPYKDDKNFSICTVSNPFENEEEIIKFIEEKIYSNK